MAEKEISEEIYDFITEDEDGRICEAIPDEACEEVPRNFLYNALNGSATKLAEQLASPELVLPWFLSALGAPAFLTGLLVPIRRAGSMLPQLAIAGHIRQFNKRKWFWITAGFTQALMLFLMLLSGIFLPPIVTGWLVILLLAFFSVASGVGSVAFKDVMAKTIPKGRRGRLLAVRATVGGILSLAAGIIIRIYVKQSDSIEMYLILIGLAAVLWFVGSLFFGAIDETKGATGGGRNALQEAKAGISLLKENPGFVKFVSVRSLLLSVKLSIPFFAIYAQKQVGQQMGTLGLFIIAMAISKIISSPFWGKFADRSSRKVLIAAGLFAITVSLITLIISYIPGDLGNAYLYAFLFLLIGLAQSGVRLGRKTYLVDGAPEKNRPLYVALSNTIIGIILLISGILGVIADRYGIQILLILFIVLELFGIFMAYIMPEAENLVPKSAQ
ncbi:MAG TPA: MFS transporter [Balneolales bacterium]|nr:MFS transporter [Balneolales bacterium]